MIEKVVFNRAPLSKNEFAELPLGAIKPQGWLKAQLETSVKTGLTGKLHLFWQDVSESAWRGKDGDGWERAPYYLDGLVPTAWLLEDESLKKVCMEYIDWTLNSQRDDGFFGPEEDTDWWPRMVMLKVLIQYFTATADERVPKFMLSYFAYQYKNLDKMPMKDWAVARGADNMQAVIWLYNLTGVKFLLRLLEKLKTQTLDWTSYFNALPVTESMKTYMPWQKLKEKMADETLSGTDRPYYRTLYFLSHVVNVAMGLKAPGVISQFKNGWHEVDGFMNGFMSLMKNHGVAYGMFTGDEHLSGNSPTQGTETCAVVELMYSIETLLATGIPKEDLGDILEKLAFNALPASMSPDMLTHQYDQQANQINCSVGHKEWYNNNETANVFGLEPNFGCCTANLHQGWPKFVEHLWYATNDNGAACVSYAPCKVSFRSGETKVKLDVDTCYPFEDEVNIKIGLTETKEFPLYLRIPNWAGEATIAVNGSVCEWPEAGEYCKLDNTWQDGDVITVRLHMTPRVTSWSRHSSAVEVGPLLMAFRPKEDWKKLNDHPFVPDFEVSTTDPWNWALIKEGMMELTTEERTVPFGMSDGFGVEVSAAKVKDWITEDMHCGKMPVYPVVKKDDEQRIRLVPYGDTCLRVSQFPTAKIK